MLLAIKQLQAVCLWRRFDYDADCLEFAVGLMATTATSATDLAIVASTNSAAEVIPAAAPTTNPTKQIADATIAVAQQPQHAISNP